MSDTVVKKSKKGRKPGKYYVNNDDLIREIRAFNKTGVFSRDLANHLIKIVEGVAHMPNFINYFKEDNPWGSEMKSDAIYRVTKAIYDKVCRIHKDEDLGNIIVDNEGNIEYETTLTDMVDNDDNPILDSDGEVKTGFIFVLDDDGKKIPKLLVQTKPFNYFTTIAYRAFQNRIKVEKKSKATIEAYKDKVYEDFEIEYGLAHKTGEHCEDDSESDSSNW